VQVWADFPDVPKPWSDDERVYGRVNGGGSSWTKSRLVIVSPRRRETAGFAFWPEKKTHLIHVTTAKLGVAADLMAKAF
jgi:hypothetical protein